MPAMARCGSAETAETGRVQHILRLQDVDSRCFKMFYVGKTRS